MVLGDLHASLIIPWGAHLAALTCGSSASIRFLMSQFVGNLYLAPYAIEFLLAGTDLLVAVASRMRSCLSAGS